MQFEWDEAKNAINIAKHGISFETASEIFRGRIISWTDDRFDYGEVREVSLGVIEAAAVIVVVHTDRSGKVRIISARVAKEQERKRYAEALRAGA